MASSVCCVPLTVTEDVPSLKPWRDLDMDGSLITSYRRVESTSDSSANAVLLSVQTRNQTQYNPPTKSTLPFSIVLLYEHFHERPPSQSSGDTPNQQAEIRDEGGGAFHSPRILKNPNCFCGIPKRLNSCKKFLPRSGSREVQLPLYSSCRQYMRWFPGTVLLYYWSSVVPICCNTK